jgi:hypothetical protein
MDHSSSNCEEENRRPNSLYSGLKDDVAFRKYKH